MLERLPKDRLVIGAYILQPYAQSEAHIRDFAACGLDLIVNLRPKDRGVLDLLSRYGVGCILSGVMPGWWGGDGENAGTMHLQNPPENYRAGAAAYVDHPAVWGIDIGDEPSALDFPYYGEVARLTAELIPGPFPYLNLYPNYASVAQNTSEQTHNQLGTRTYAEHIERYLEHVGLPYVSYDFYLYALPEADGVRRMLDNFRIVSEGCLRTGRRFWYIPQVNSVREEEFTSLNRLRYQGYAGLCYGASVINWACYTAGWWKNNVLDESGNRTEQYEKLRTVNEELRRVGDPLAAYAYAGTALVGYPEEDLGDGELTSAERISRGPVTDLHAGGASLIAGFFEHRKEKGRTAVLVLNASDPYDRGMADAELSFAAGDGPWKCIGTDLSAPVSKDGRWTLRLPAGQAALLLFG